MLKHGTFLLWGSSANHSNPVILQICNQFLSTMLHVLFILLWQKKINKIPKAMQSIKVICIILGELENIEIKLLFFISQFLKSRLHN